MWCYNQRFSYYKTQRVTTILSYLHLIISKTEVAVLQLLSCTTKYNNIYICKTISLTQRNQLTKWMRNVKVHFTLVRHGTDDLTAPCTPESEPLQHGVANRFLLGRETTPHHFPASLVMFLFISYFAICSI